VEERTGAEACAHSTIDVFIFSFIGSVQSLGVFTLQNSVAMLCRPGTTVVNVGVLLGPMLGQDRNKGQRETREKQERPERDERD